MPEKMKSLEASEKEHETPSPTKEPAPPAQQYTSGLARIQRAVGNLAIQRAAKASLADKDDGLAQRLQMTSAAGGERLDQSVRTPLEQGLGADLSDVRVHTDREADSLARAMNSLAFTSGSHIFFREGEYNPGSEGGRHLLVHEAVHTIQQAAGPVAGSPGPGDMSVSHPSDPFEQEATRVADSATTGSSATPRTTQKVSSSPGITRRAPAAAHGFHSVQRQPQPGQAVPPTGPTEPDVTPSGTDLADEYESEAMRLWTDDMDIELRTAAGVEGVSIGRRASSTAALMVQQACEPFNRDQEIDTLIMNTVFALAGGGASVTEAGTSGTSQAPGSSGANIGSRIVRAGLALTWLWMPKLAGYKTVGQLKDAAIAALGEGAAQGGETGSSQFQDYEAAVMEALLEEYLESITSVRRTIESDSNPQAPYYIARAFLPSQRANYLYKLRNDYGAQSSHAGAMVNAITASLQPKLEILKTHLQEAKESRQLVQGLGAIGAGIAGGAAIGAGIGVWGFGVTALPGAIIGGIVGGAIGLGAAIAIWWD